MHTTSKHLLILNNMNQLSGVWQMKWALSGLILFYLALAGCSSKPVYRTDYQLIEPSSINGRQCTTQCATNRLLCQQNENSERMRCEDQGKQRSKQCKKAAYQDYRQCMHQSQYGGKHRGSMESSCNSIKNSKVQQCDSGYNRCERRSRCEPKYRACFSNCGGKVKAKTYCVRNCDKKK